MSTANFKTQKYFDLYASHASWDIDTEDYILLDDTLDFLREKLNPQLEFFRITLEDGYYQGVQTLITDTCQNFDPIDFIDYYDSYDGKDIFADFGYNKHILKQKIQKEINIINTKLLPQLKDYAFDRYTVIGRFSNGETLYAKE